MFNLIGGNLTGMRVDSIIVEKRKAHPAVRQEARFYPEHLTRLLSYVVKGWGFTQALPETVVFTDSLPFRRKRRAIEGAIKSALKQSLAGMPYRIFHHQSRSHAGLQVADYCCWAIQRKWNMGANAEYNLIQTSVKSEFDVYQTGVTFYY